MWLSADSYWYPAYAGFSVPPVFQGLLSDPGFLYLQNTQLPSLRGSQTQPQITPLASLTEVTG